MQRLLVFSRIKYFEYTSVSVKTSGGVFIMLKICELQQPRLLNWNFLHVYICQNCQHDRSDRCYFCIFKNEFVVYKVFYFFVQINF